MPMRLTKTTIKITPAAKFYLKESNVAEKSIKALKEYLDTTGTSITPECISKEIKSGKDTIIQTILYPNQITSVLDFFKDLIKIDGLLLYINKLDPLIEIILSDKKGD